MPQPKESIRVVDKVAFYSAKTNASPKNFFSNQFWFEMDQFGSRNFCTGVV